MTLIFLLLTLKLLF
jgi:hypothetical protein